VHAESTGSRTADVRDPEPGWEAPGAGAGPAKGHTSVGQLAWLALLIGVAIEPHAGAVDTWVLAALAGALLWRLGAALWQWQLPNTPLRVALTLSGSFAVVYTYRKISGLDAGSALLILMLALKLIETHSTRDRSIVILIAWFVLFASFLREQSVMSVPQLAGGVIIGTLALLQSARPATLLTPGRALQMTGRLLLQAVPLALALFLLFPRLPGPFWALPSAGGGGRTGLADQMSPGDITSLAQSDEVAFRVRFNGLPPAPAELYWRGPVLERFDGRRWRTQRESGRDRIGPDRDYAARATAGQRLYSYELTLEPNQQRWLLPLETPLSWDAPGSTLTGTLELLQNRPIDRRMAWRGQSVALGGFNDARTPQRINLDLPADTNPRSRALALKMRLDAASDEDYLRRILTMFRKEQFFYTLQPPALGTHPVDDFLFRARSGFCEHYASAFAVLARAGGLPARVVAGYQGAERNPVADYWIVRQSDAHAWTEVWLDGRWVRYDPTAAVAPERIESGLDAALPGLARNELPLLGNSEWFERVALSWDAVNATWDRWVLAFGPDQQSALLEGLGIQSPTLRDIALACAVTVSVVLLLFTWFGSRASRRRPDPVEEAWQRLCRLLAKRVRAREPAEGPAEYAAAVARMRPDIGATIEALASHYLRLRYDKIPTATETQRFAQLVRQLRVPPETAIPQ
jgi:transglutaminase-like putative cysteine protease